MKKILSFILVLAMVGTMLSGCAATSQPAASSAAAPAASSAAAPAASSAAAPVASSAAAAPAEKQVIGVSADDYSSAFWQACINGAVDKAKALGYEVDVQVCAGDPSLQNKQIEDMLARGDKAILCAPNDSKTIIQAVKKCNAANVPFIYIDRTVESTADAKVAFGAGTDNTALAQAAMEWMGDYAKKNNLKLKVCELTGYLGDPNSVARSQGVKNAIGKYSDVMELVKQVPTENDIEKTLKGTVNALQENKDINCIFMVADYFLDATLSALKQTSKLYKTGDPNHVYIVTYDGAKVSLVNIKDGYIDACGVQDCSGNGALCAEAADKILKGQDPGAVVKNPGFVLTAENYDQMAQKAFGYNEK